MPMRRAVSLLLCLLLLPAAAWADFGQGKVAYDSGNWRQAILNLRPAAEKGDARAMVLLGNMYAEGHGVEQNMEEAFMLYRRAAQLDNPDGILATATLYQAGKGVPQNTRLAILWFERGARLGHQASAFFYAIHLYQGSKGDTYDFKPDHAAAYKWFRIAEAGKGFPEIGRRAGMLANEIAKKLNPVEAAAADRAAGAWRPEKPADLGPAPDIASPAQQEEEPASPAEPEAAPEAEDGNGTPDPAAPPSE